MVVVQRSRFVWQASQLPILRPPRFPISKDWKLGLMRYLHIRSVHNIIVTQIITPLLVIVALNECTDEHFPMRVC